jgi:hypothetical protein
MELTFGRVTGAKYQKLDAGWYRSESRTGAHCHVMFGAARASTGDQIARLLGKSVRSTDDGATVLTAPGIARIVLQEVPVGDALFREYFPDVTGEVMATLVTLPECNEKLESKLASGLRKIMTHEPARKLLADADLG